MAIPLIGTALAAIASALAKRGLDLLSGIFRGAVEQGANKISELIQEKTGIDVHDIAENKITEDQWITLKEFELANQEQLLEFRKSIEAHKLEMEKLRLEDTKNARSTQTERDKNADPVVRRFTYYYAYVITILTFLFIFMAAFLPAYFSSGTDTGRKIPAESWRVIDTVLGFLLGVGLSAIIQFFYGSSSGSQKKSEELSRLTDQLASGKSSGKERN